MYSVLECSSAALFAHAAYIILIMGKITLQKRLCKALELFLYFFHISWFTFGGGWSLVAQIQKDYVEKKHEISDEELLDMVSVARSLPGTMIGNVAYLFGYHAAGFAGGILSVIGLVTPSMIILSVITIFYSKFKGNEYFAKAFVGVRAAVVPIIAVAAFKLRNGAFPVKVCYAVAAIACILSAVFNVNAVLIVCLGLLAGLLISRYYKEVIDHE